MNYVLFPRFKTTTPLLSGIQGWGCNLSKTPSHYTTSFRNFHPSFFFFATLFFCLTVFLSLENVCWVWKGPQERCRGEVGGKPGGNCYKPTYSPLFSFFFLGLSVPHNFPKTKSTVTSSSLISLCPVRPSNEQKTSYFLVFPSHLTSFCLSKKSEKRRRKAHQTTSLLSFEQRLSPSAADYTHLPVLCAHADT